MATKIAAKLAARTLTARTAPPVPAPAAATRAPSKPAASAPPPAPPAPVKGPPGKPGAPPGKPPAAPEAAPPAQDKHHVGAAILTARIEAQEKGLASLVAAVQAMQKTLETLAKKAAEKAENGPHWATVADLDTAHIKTLENASDDDWRVAYHAESVALHGQSSDKAGKLVPDTSGTYAYRLYIPRDSDHEYDASGKTVLRTGSAGRSGGLIFALWETNEEGAYNTRTGYLFSQEELAALWPES